MKALDTQEFIFSALCWQRVETEGLRPKVPFTLGARSDILKTGSRRLLIVMHAFLCLQIPPSWLQVKWSQSGLSSLDPTFVIQPTRSTVKGHPWKVLSLQEGQRGGRQDRGYLSGLRPLSRSLLPCLALILLQGTALLQRCVKTCCDPPARGLSKAASTTFPSPPSWQLSKWNYVSIL